MLRACFAPSWLLGFQLHLRRFQFLVLGKRKVHLLTEGLDPSLASWNLLSWKGTQGSLIPNKPLCASLGVLSKPDPSPSSCPCFGHSPRALDLFYAEVPQIPDSSGHRIQLESLWGCGSPGVPTLEMANPEWKIPGMLTQPPLPSPSAPILFHRRAGGEEKKKNKYFGLTLLSH